MLLLSCLCLLFISGINLVNGHGRLMEPPNRSSLWRFKEFSELDPPINYDDNALYCGGFGTQYDKNGGRCGFCGDNWADPQPRENEDGGKFGRGIIAKNYSSGQVIDISVELTTSHKGFFDFFLCVRNWDKEKNKSIPVESEDCFKKYHLTIADGTTTGYKYAIPTYDKGFYNTKVKLPSGVTGDRSVLLWDYTAGNRWASCGNGTAMNGCGDQEIFRGCADISIR